MVQHFLTWLDRNIGFDVDPDHARTRPGRFISRSFFSCGLTTKVHAPRVSMILTHHSRPATSTMTLFSFRYAACTPSSRKDSKKECEEIFDEPFFWGVWWKESKRRFWQRSFLLVDNSLYYYWLIDSIYGFTCDLPDYGENCIGKMIMIMKTKVFSIWRLNNDDF